MNKRLLHDLEPCLSEHSAFSPSTERDFISLEPTFTAVQSANLDEVKEFVVIIDSFPSARVTWLKDGKVLNDVKAEVTSNLRRISETR